MNRQIQHLAFHSADRFLRGRIPRSILIVTLILGASAGCSTQAGRIEQVLALDAQTTTGAKSVAEVVARMQAIDTSSCPGDFRAAYLAHQHAWESLAVVEQQALAFQQNNQPSAVFLESFLRGFLGDPFGKTGEILAGTQQLQTNYEQTQREIQATFHRVQECAVQHGARLPPPRR